MKTIKKYLLFPTILLLFVLLMQVIWRSFPNFYKIVYQRGIFKVIRLSYDYLLGIWLPIPFVGIALSIIIYLIFIRSYKHRNMGQLLAQIMGHSMIVFSLFYILWGWNYAQPSLATLLDIEPITADSTRLYQEADWLVKELNSTRATLQDDSLPLSTHVMDRYAMENLVREKLSQALEEINFVPIGRPRVRVLKPKGVLLRFKTAGIYMPYAFEGHIDGGLLELEWPYTMAHEMSHAYGVTDEGECNFTAYLACMNSDEPYFRYSALIDYALYILRDIKRVDKRKHKLYLSQLHPGFFADLNAMKLNNDQYPDILPAFRDMLYDSYLKSNGVKAGLQSYSQLVNLIIQYKDKQ